MDDSEQEKRGQGAKNCGGEGNAKGYSAEWKLGEQLGQHDVEGMPRGMRDSQGLNSCGEFG